MLCNKVTASFDFYSIRDLVKGDGVKAIIVRKNFQLVTIFFTFASPK
jgi:hypothetical protein